MLSHLDHVRVMGFRRGDGFGSLHGVGVCGGNTAFCSFGHKASLIERIISSAAATAEELEMWHVFSLFLQT